MNKCNHETACLVCSELHRDECDIIRWIFIISFANCDTLETQKEQSHLLITFFSCFQRFETLHEYEGFDIHVCHSIVAVYFELKSMKI